MTDDSLTFMSLAAFAKERPGEAMAAKMFRDLCVEAADRNLSPTDFLRGSLMSLVQLASTGDPPSREAFANDMEAWASALRAGRVIRGRVP